MEEMIKEALMNGPDDGLTSPQIHSVVPGEWEEVSGTLRQMEEEGTIVQTNDAPGELWAPGDPYPRYVFDQPVRAGER